MNPQGDFSNRLAGELVGDVVRKFGSVRLRAFGTSMLPAILPGDLISIERSALDEIAVGDVVLFTQNNRLFIHRVVTPIGFSHAGNTQRSQLITRGDRLQHNDPPVHAGGLLGRVVAIQRGDRQVDPTARRASVLSRLARFILSSDRAAYLYVRLAALHQSFHVGRASCQV